MRHILMTVFAIPFFLFSVGTSLLAQEFPLTIEHKFGTTVIESKPERVASIDADGADYILALGVQPLVIRHLYDAYPRSVFPWADVLLEGTPVVLKDGIDIQAIAAVDPDIIIALASGITASEYEKLSQIAPVIAVAEGTENYAMTWRARAILTGRVLGLEVEAIAKVEAIQTELADIAAAHPDWAGKSAVIADIWGEAPGEYSTIAAYTSIDVHAQILADLGFETPAAIDEMMEDGDGHWVEIDLGDLSPLEGDLLIWLTQNDQFELVLALDAHPFLEVTKKGHEVIVGELLGSAFSHATLLSLPYAIETLVPMIEAALDGDPNTYADDRDDAR